MSRRDPTKQVRSGIVGWGAAQRILDRCKEAERRELFAGLVVQAGVQGAPAMEYVTRLLRWHADGADYPTPSGSLAEIEYRYCQRRAIELLRPFVGDRRLGKVRGLDERAAA